jgi:MFS family permease
MVARFLTGIGTGIETSTVPMYQSELCEASKRGRLVASEPLFVGVGIELAYWFDYGMSFTEGSIAWRLPIACQVIFAMIVIVLVFGLPESPRYLYAHGRQEEALQILCDVYDGTPDDPKIEKENREVLEALQVEREHGEYKWSQLLKKDRVQTGRRVLLAYGAQFMNQMGGINLVRIPIQVPRACALTSCANVSGSLLYHIRPRRQRRPRQKPLPPPRRRHQPHVFPRLSRTNLHTRPHRPAKAHDVGFSRARAIHDDDCYPLEFPDCRW